MITKQDILNRAREWQLRPEVVEKDYVLGWLLAAVAADPETSLYWVLKGGTCIKKCFFETYRFSEDLDFTLKPEAGYSGDVLQTTLSRLAHRVEEMTGIAFRDEAITVRERQDKQGKRTFEGRVGYQGPLAVPGWPRILFDITQNEPIIDEPVFRKVLHPYPDELPPDTLVQTYSFEELVGEKTRALFDRTRPRDLYDIVFITENAATELSVVRAREVFTRKCEVKGMDSPTLGQFVTKVSDSAELRSDWEAMLAHQLPQLPGVESVLVRLSSALSWLEPAIPAPSIFAPARIVSNDQVVVSRTPRLWNEPVPMEAVRFAGANRLLVEFYYSGKLRVVEPYSLRRARSTGNLLLYAWELSTHQIKCFNVAKMSTLRTTDRTFVPRYEIELTTGATFSESIPYQIARPRLTRTPRSRSTSYHGPTYVLRCVTCGREFRRRKNERSLRRHKYPQSDMICPGRRGYLDRVQ